jgi:hypothetical protein
MRPDGPFFEVQQRRIKSLDMSHLQERIKLAAQLHQLFGLFQTARQRFFYQTRYFVSQEIAGYLIVSVSWNSDDYGIYQTD